ncbi:MAG: hypothetical protein KKA48_00275, partial [Proteobacteria bacterium]|nr:hypothetical protein [Pseudomonadota bacterium]
LISNPIFKQPQAIKTSRNDDDRDGQRLAAFFKIRFRGFFYPQIANLYENAGFQPVTINVIF